MGKLNEHNIDEFENKLEDRSFVSESVRQSSNILNALDLFDEKLSVYSYPILYSGVYAPKGESSCGVLNSKFSPELTRFLSQPADPCQCLMIDIACNGDRILKNVKFPKPEQADFISRRLAVELTKFGANELSIIRVNYNSQIFVFLIGCGNADLDDQNYQDLSAICQCFISALAVKYSIEDILARSDLQNSTEKNFYSITDRQKQCLLWIASGKTSYEISVILGLSEHTINNYITDACKRLRAVSRVQAVIMAAQMGLIDVRL